MVIKCDCGEMVDLELGSKADLPLNYGKCPKCDRAYKLDDFQDDNIFDTDTLHGKVKELEERVEYLEQKIEEVE